MANNVFDSFKVPPDFKKNLVLFRRILLGLVIVAFLWTTFFQVDPEEVGVITRFGKYVRQVEPGLNFKLPFIEKINRVPVERFQGGKRERITDAHGRSQSG